MKPTPERHGTQRGKFGGGLVALASTPFLAGAERTMDEKLDTAALKAKAAGVSWVLNSMAAKQRVTGIRKSHRASFTEFFITPTVSLRTTARFWDATC